MSGDMHINIRPEQNVPFASGTLKSTEQMDANSIKSGNMTEGRNVGGQQVFMTPAGAGHFDDLTSKGYTSTAGKDGIPGVRDIPVIGGYLSDRMSTRESQTYLGRPQ